jgi:biotin-[acetyl-CoA-carboxylase] ligase BirA-like protein
VAVELGPDEVRPLLRGSFGRAGYLYAASCPSTQRLPPADAPHGTVAVTEHQTEGRGRLGRVWEDEPGGSLLFSLVLRPTRPVREWPSFTAVAGEAAAEAVEAIADRMPLVKPPNDLLLGRGKVAGILAEAQEDRIVLGIGVNVTATPYEGAAALGPVDRRALLAELLFRLERAFDAWDATRLATAADGPRLLELFTAARSAQGMGAPVSELDKHGWTEHVLAGETWLHPHGFATLAGGVLEYLYVHPDAQGRGIGGMLIALAKQRLPDGFRLWVFQHLVRSRRFYERHGCVLVEETDGSANMERLPDALYEWLPPGR